MEDSSTWDTRFRDSTQFWVQFVFFPLVVIIGVLGNSITIYILTRKQMRLSSKVYLTALTLSDLIFLLFSFSMSWKHYECMQSVELYWNYIPFGLWITDASSSTSVWLTATFTIERYIAICHPMLAKSHSHKTEHRAAIISTGVYLFCFLLTSHISFEWEAVATHPDQNSSLNYTVYSLENTDLGKNAGYKLISRWFSTFVFVLIPLTILVVGNIFLIHAVRSSHKIRQGLVSCYVHRRQARRMRQKDRITINLIVIIVVFFVCQLPTAAVLIYTSVHTPLKDSVEENVLLGLGNLFKLLMAINAECNFILYTAISNRYRKSFLRLCCINSIINRSYDISYKNSVIVAPKVRKILESKSGSTCHSGERRKSDGMIDANLVEKQNLLVLRKCTTCEIIRKGTMSTSSEESQSPKKI